VHYKIQTSFEDEKDCTQCLTVTIIMVMMMMMMIWSTRYTRAFGNECIMSHKVATEDSCLIAA
jgi:hypothetical protein